MSTIRGQKSFHDSEAYCGAHLLLSNRVSALLVDISPAKPLAEADQDSRYEKPNLTLYIRLYHIKYATVERIISFRRVVENYRSLQCLLVFKKIFIQVKATNI
jgi:hypothetical protein